MKKNEKKGVDWNVLILLIALALILILSFFVFWNEQKISGKLILNLALNNSIISGNSPIPGILNIRLNQGDLIPSSSIVKFKIQKVKCDYFYVCTDGTLIPWQEYNSETNSCEDLGDWRNGPWESCPTSRTYEEYFCNEFENSDGTPLQCCNTGGIGEYYPNLKCQGNAECWTSCAPTTTSSFREIISISTTPLKGNLTQGNFRNVGGPVISGEGEGYSACVGEIEQNLDITGRAVPGCSDTDGGVEYSVKGICTDSESYTDSCLTDTKLREYSCGGGNVCVSEVFTCPNGCGEGKCLDSPPSSQCTDGTPYNSCSLTKPKYCDNGVLIDSCSVCGCDSTFVCNSISNKCVAPSGGSSGGGGVACTESWTCTSWPDSCPQNGIQTRTCTDLNNCETAHTKPAETQTCQYALPENSCVNWNNIYSIDLTRLNELRAPNRLGVYNISTALLYNQTTLFFSSTIFSVTDMDNSNRNNTNEEELLRCNENWNCREWGSCINGTETRFCEDLNVCGTAYLKPITEKICGTKCNSNWNCETWSLCETRETQSRTCKDKNLCDASKNIYEEERICCIEKWESSWSKCSNNTQQKIYTDSNQCGTSFTKPGPEERNCRIEFPFTPKQQITIIILILSMAIIFLISEIVRRKYFQKDGKKEESSIEEAQREELIREISNEERLAEYIRKAYSLGIRKSLIKEKLLEEGWPEEMIDKVLNSEEF